MVLGVEFMAVRIVPGEDGKIEVPLKTNHWVAPRAPFRGRQENLLTRSGRCPKAMRSGKRGKKRD